MRSLILSPLLPNPNINGPQSRGRCCQVGNTSSLGHEFQRTSEIAPALLEPPTNPGLLTPRMDFTRAVTWTPIKPSPGPNSS